MLRKRARANVSINTLIRTICHRDRDAEPLRPDLGQRASVCGRVDIAYPNRLHQVRDDNVFVTCWVELREDMLVIVESDSSGGRQPTFRPKTVTFASKVTPPAASFLTTPEMKMIASKLTVRSYLAVYGTGDHPCLWIAFTDKNDLDNWLHVIHDTVTHRDGAPAWTERQAAYRQLEPLV